MKRLFPLARFLAHAMFVLAVGLLLSALVLTVAACHVMSAPYRWTREQQGDKRARLEAGAAILTALYALYQTRPRPKASDG